MLVLRDSSLPLLRNGFRLVGCLVEPNHYRHADTLYGIGRYLYDTLHKRETLITDRRHCSLYLYIVRQEYGRQKVYFGVYYHHIDIFRIDMLTAYHLKVFGLTKVVKKEIHRVVDMPQSIGIVEPQLYGHFVIENNIFHRRAEDYLL